MFSLDTPQRVCHIGALKVGGQPGENPPLLIASMFHKGDRLLISRKERTFDRVRAADLIKRQEELSLQTGIPALVAMVATTADEMKTYIDFHTSVTDAPFAIDMWTAHARLEATRYVAELGLQDRLLYNSITPWDKDIPGQVAQMKEMGVRHVVVQAFEEQDPTPGGRVTSFRKLMEAIGDRTFDSILVDTAVMNLPAIGFSVLAARLIKEQYGWPAGSAPSNGTYMWELARKEWDRKFAHIDAAAHAVSAMLWSDFLFYGPLVNAPRIFPAVAAAILIQSTMVYHEAGRVTAGAEHPLRRFFNEFVTQLEGRQASP